MDYDKVRPDQIKMMLGCNDYIPECILIELQRLNDEVANLKQEIIKLKAQKVDRTPIVPDREYKQQELPETD